MKSFFASSWSLCLLMAAIATVPAEAQFGAMVKRVPDHANAIVVFDVAKVHASPIAQREGWETEHHEAFKSGLVVLPPDTSRFMLASHLDFEFMESMWDAAILDMSETRELDTIAKNLGGTVDRLAGVPAVHLPNDSYVVQFGEREFGTMAPGNRQTVGRWVRSATMSKTSTLSPYLLQAAGYVANVGTPIIMAMDLQDVLIPQTIESRISSSGVLSDRQVDIKQLSKKLATIKGITLGITFKENPFASIKVDFGEDVSDLAGLAKPLIIQALSRHGAHLEDLDTWREKVSGNTVTLSGGLSNSGLRRILSVIDAPMTAFHSGASENDSQQQQGSSDPAVASKQYFDSIRSLFDDLQGKRGTASHINMYGVWFDKYAQKIDRLPLLNVDSELLDYGQYVAQQFRNAAASVKGIGMRSRVRQVNEVASSNAVPYNWGERTYSGYRYGRYGWYGGSYNTYSPYLNTPGGALNANLAQQQSIRTQVRTQERVRGAAGVQEIVGEIKTATSNIRRKMTEKYQVEF